MKVKHPYRFTPLWSKGTRSDAITYIEHRINDIVVNMQNSVMIIRFQISLESLISSHLIVLARNNAAQYLVEQLYYIRQNAYAESRIA